MTIEREDGAKWDREKEAFVGGKEPVAVLATAPELDLSEIGVDHGWKIDSLQALEWALERLGDAETVISQNEDLAAQAESRIQSRLAECNKAPQRTAEFFRGAILGYLIGHRGEVLGKGKAKSRKLIGGTVGFRSSRETIRVEDEEAALAWAKDQPVASGLVVVRASLSKAALNEHFKATGEVPPGCSVDAAEDIPYVKAEPQVLPELLEPKKLTP